MDPWGSQHPFRGGLQSQDSFRTILRHDLPFHCVDHYTAETLVESRQWQQTVLAVIMFFSATYG